MYHTIRINNGIFVLWGLCHTSLQNKITAHPDFAAMKGGGVGELYPILSKLCNVSITMTTEDMI